MGAFERAGLDPVAILREAGPASGAAMEPAMLIGTRA
jgi:hypothetical protein